MEKPKRKPEHPLMDNETVQKPKIKPEHALMYAIGFTEEDLEANREGWLSERQRAELNRQRREMLVGIIALLVVSLFVFLIGLFSYRDKNASAVIPVLVLTTGGAIYIAYRWGNKDADFQGKRVEFVEGRVELRLGSNKSATCSIFIQNRAFLVSNEVFLAFKNGDPYVIYYTPASKTILSAEWLREE